VSSKLLERHVGTAILKGSGEKMGNGKCVIFIHRH
jgi:hypothetical protein